MGTRKETGSPVWKLYDSAGKYQASAKEVEFLAAGIGFYGKGATIKYDHHLKVWTEGVDGTAADSYDFVVKTTYARVTAFQQATYDKHQAYLRSIGY
jgi:hypothetical protein